MNEMLNKIPEKCYSSELKKVVFRLLSNNETSIDTSISKLINCELTDSSFREIYGISIGELQISDINNKELIARLNDFLFLINDKDKIKCVQDAVEAYIEIYSQTRETKYLSRAFTLVHKVKSIFKSDNTSRF